MSHTSPVRLWLAVLMAVAILTGVVAFRGAPAGAANGGRTVPPVPNLTPANVRACMTVIHAKKSVTKKGIAACGIGDVTIAFPCPNGRIVWFYDGATTGARFYILRAGHRPERAVEPFGDAQINYLCAHGTEIGGPPST